MMRMSQAIGAAVALLALGAAGCAGQIRSPVPATGFAVVECGVAPDGRPVDCRVVSEEPAGMGFGAAAVGIVQRGLRARDGAAAGSKFVVRVPFSLDD